MGRPQNSMAIAFAALVWITVILILTLKCLKVANQALDNVNFNVKSMQEIMDGNH